MRVVPHEKAAEFKQKMIDIILDLPNRSFDLLREKALVALREMYKNENSHGEKKLRRMLDM